MKNNTTKYKAVKNEEIAEAIVELATPMIKASGGDTELIQALIEIAVNAWNISLFKPSANDYNTEIEGILPKKLDETKAVLFKSFIKFMIKEKQSRYPDFLKGIKNYKCSIDSGKITLNIEALPVKPNNIN